MTMRTFVLDVQYQGEPAAGFLPFDEEVTVCVKSGDLGSHEEEFLVWLGVAFSDWYDGARVIVREVKVQ